ncbi:hypothetical protein FEZ18_03320 [Oceanihabitans sp. IOP_32]|uniref:hypothetical protein n=1 Tax=Oceanihabitans sp. IOP_32 TaxID=2529032 RepID=UPI001292D24B|nr:hypothetical protein [Oceanihabitans sp. IOP_32]QFZ53907.1 hypothetical protein FEZ18_03320 [Oceanihabitans sp. IOP_32]
MVKKTTLIFIVWLHILPLTATPILNKKYCGNKTELVSYNDLISNKLEENELPLYFNETITINQKLLKAPKVSNFNLPKENIAKPSTDSDSLNQDRQEASGSFQVIEDNKSWVDSFSNEDIQELPVGVKHIRENIEYAIGITQATINKDYTELTVFARVKLPQTNSNGNPIELFFGANNVKLSHQGGIVGDANLVLLGDLNIPFNAGKWMLTLKGGFDYKTGNVQNLTYVTINCDGVKELGIQGVVEFSRDLILPLTEDGKVDLREKILTPITTENGTQTIEVFNRVRGAFNVVASDWNDLLIGIDLQPFVLTQKRNNKDYNGNFQFHVNQAVLDFSDIRNDPMISNAFPNYYHENGLLLPNERTWRGVYVNTVQVKLPTEFKTNNTINRGKDERVTFGAHHLIIDNYGVSGTFYADNVFTLDEGRTNDSKAWAYSLDHIEISLAANNFIGADLEGRILLPISQAENPNKTSNELGMAYKGLITEEEYLLNVKNDSIVDFNLWNAKGQLLPNSAIELAVRDGRFRPKATLHGNLKIRANQKKEQENNNINKENLVEFDGITFQNLRLQTETPLFAVDYMGYTGEVKLANFPVSISDIGISANEFNANLYFDLAINLMGKDNGFAAKTSLTILGKFKEENYLQKWGFEGVDLDAIAVDADLGGFAIWGNLELMNDDPVYGNGFGATLGARFDVLQTEIEVNAIFGKTDFRYWMVDAMVDLPPAVGTGIINLSGFAGGASYNMRRQDFGAAINGDAFTYTPDKNYGLGLKAMVLLSLGDGAVLEGGVGFEILFNDSGGISQLGLYGQASMMGVKISGLDNITSALNKFNESATAKAKFLGYNEDAVNNSFVGRNLLDKAENEMIKVPHGDLTISTKLGVVFDFDNEVLHGELETFVNTPGGFVRGNGVNGRSGLSVIHLSKKEWYLYLGTPNNPQGFKIGVGPLNYRSEGYFMVGSIIPGSPPPPPEVSSILNLPESHLDYMRDENALKSGRGFAFG